MSPASAQPSLPSPAARRRWLGRAGGVLGALAMGTLPLAWSGCAATAPIDAGRAGSDALQAVADGLWLWRGHGGEIDDANGGRVGNAAVLVGSRGVLVVDSGCAHRHGQALLAAIAQRTPLPVRALLLTHARQEFVFGASAFRAAGIPVLMGRRSAQLMAARCEGCLRTLRRVLGDQAMAGTELVKPDRLLDPPADGALALPDLAQAIGRDFTLQGHGHSSGPGDLALHDGPSGWLVAGGLADVRRIPDIQDAELGGWRRALLALKGLQSPPIRGIVPGHGAAVAGVGPLDEVARYLDELDAATAALARRGVALSEVPDAAALPHFEAWDQYDTIHRRNASILFLRHERQLMNAT